MTTLADAAHLAEGPPTGGAQVLEAVEEDGEGVQEVGLPRLGSPDAMRRDDLIDVLVVRRS